MIEFTNERNIGKKHLKNSDSKYGDENKIIKKQKTPKRLNDTDSHNHDSRMENEGCPDARKEPEKNSMSTNLVTVKCQHGSNICQHGRIKYK